MSDELRGEEIDYLFIGMKPIRRKKNPGRDPNTIINRRVGVSFSSEMLARLDTLARQAHPGGRGVRSRFIREMLEVGLDETLGGDWEGIADEIMAST